MQRPLHSRFFLTTTKQLFFRRRGRGRRRRRQHLLFVSSYTLMRVDTSPSLHLICGSALMPAIRARWSDPCCSLPPRPHFSHILIVEPIRAARLIEAQKKPSSSTWRAPPPPSSSPPPCRHYPWQRPSARRFTRQTCVPSGWFGWCTPTSTAVSHSLHPRPCT